MIKPKSISQTFKGNNGIANGSGLMKQFLTSNNTPALTGKAADNKEGHGSILPMIGRTPQPKQQLKDKETKQSLLDIFTSVNTNHDRHSQGQSVIHKMQ